MDVQQLRMILDAVKDVSGAAQVVGILWAAEGYFVSVLGFGVLGYAIAKVCGLIRWHISRDATRDRVDRLLSRAVQKHPDDCMYDSDYEKIERWIRLGKEAETEGTER